MSYSMIVISNLGTVFTIIATLGLVCAALVLILYTVPDNNTNKVVRVKLCRYLRIAFIVSASAAFIASFLPSEEQFKAIDAINIEQKAEGK